VRPPWSGDMLQKQKIQGSFATATDPPVPLPGQGTCQGDVRQEGCPPRPHQGSGGDEVVTRRTKSAILWKYASPPATKTSLWPAPGTSYQVAPSPAA